VPRRRPTQSLATRVGLQALGAAKVAGSGASRARQGKSGMLLIAGLGAGAAALGKRRRQRAQDLEPVGPAEPPVAVPADGQPQPAVAP
jgi:hypothetical protein